VIHYAGTPIKLGPIGRQRCCWCGVLIDEWDFENTMSTGDATITPWEVGALIEFRGHVKIRLREGAKDGEVLLPVLGSCAYEAKK
jgi:hypothetical protein